MTFTLEVEESWLDALDSLLSSVLSQPTSSPEEALEFALCSQLRDQRLASRVLRCWYCDGRMTFRTFRSCFGEIAEFYECDKCHFTLDRSFVETCGSERPTAA